MHITLPLLLQIPPPWLILHHLPQQRIIAVGLSEMILFGESAFRFALLLQFDIHFDQRIWHPHHERDGLDVLHDPPVGQVVQRPLMLPIRDPIIAVHKKAKPIIIKPPQCILHARQCRPHVCLHHAENTPREHGCTCQPRRRKNRADGLSASPYLQHQPNENRDGVKVTQRRPPLRAFSVVCQNLQHHQHLKSHPLHEGLVPSCSGWLVLGRFPHCFDALV